MVTTRASARLSPAQCYDHASLKQPRYRRPKRIRSTDVGFKLLELPWEVRQLVLRELLWQSEPVLFQSTDSRFSGPRAVRTIDDPSYADYWDNRRDSGGMGARKFYPEVLRVCKQLHEEGSPILYDNTIECLINLSSEDGSMERFMGPAILGQRYRQKPCGSFGKPMPDAVLSKMRKARVQISTPPVQRLARRLHDCSETVRRAVSMLQAHSLNELTIELVDQTPNDGDYNINFSIFAQFVPRSVRDEAECRDDLLRQFLYLRNCKVNVLGASPELTLQLQETMSATSVQRPVYRLDEMLNAMVEYTELMQSGWHRLDGTEQARLLAIERGLGDLEEYQRRVMVAEFLAKRRSLLAQISRFVLDRQSLVFEHDPACTPHVPLGSTLKVDDGDYVSPEGHVHESFHSDHS